jgi:effector-binding domain-containing protein
MDYVVTESNDAPFHFAAIHDRTTMPDLSRKIERHVTTALKSLRDVGRPFEKAVVLYWDHEEEKSLIESPDGVEIDVGWQVDDPFVDHATGVETVTTPAGPYATTTHIGTYDTLYLAHRAIRQWCKKEGRTKIGPNWEVYDHPRDGVPTRTDVYYVIG